MEQNEKNIYINLNSTLKKLYGIKTSDKANKYCNKET